MQLQWTDSDTGKRKTKSAETHIRSIAEMKRTELEYELNHGLHQEDGADSAKGYPSESCE